MLPCSIWSTIWTPHDGSVPNRYNLENFSLRVLEYANTGGPGSKFSVSGKTMQDIVKNFLDAIRDAAAKNDFSQLLSPDREFLM